MKDLVRGVSRYSIDTSSSERLQVYFRPSIWMDLRAAAAGSWAFLDGAIDCISSNFYQGWCQMRRTEKQE